MSILRKIIQGSPRVVGTLIVMSIWKVDSHPSIRFATGWDLRQVLQIDRVSFSRQWDYDTFKSALKDVFFVFEERKILKKLRGFLVASYSEGTNSVMIRKVAVHPGHRNKGIGTRFIKAVLDELAKMNVREVNLHVHISNTGAIKLYERLGFKIVQIDRPDYAEDESFYLMRLNLDKPSD